MQHRQLLADWFETVWVNGDFEAVDRYFAPEAHADGLMPGMELRPEDFKILVQALLNLIGDPKIRIIFSMEHGDWLSALIEVSCVSAINAEKLAFNGQVMMRVRDGKIVEAYNHFDLVSLFQQLGMLPPDAMEMFLAGAAAA